MCINKWINDFLPILGTFFLLLVCFVQLQYDSFCFNLLYFILVDCHLLEVYSLLMKDKKGVDSNGREVGKKLGGVEGGKIVIKL